MWRCLEEGKNFLSASSFNLYYRYGVFGSFKKKKIIYELISHGLM
jgi:hypothetical protein